ncbi:MAG TPA: ABC transporter permease, partial [Candidatus Atribacteria bacterium]|nr:ABC transporter permease [Candidatus Atribacteria bacterium]
MKRYLKSKNFLIGFVIVSLIVIMAVISFFYTPYDPNKMYIRNRLKPPSTDHILGTDQYGRDILSRIMKGSVNSIFVGVVSVGIGLLFGLILGAFAAYSGGWKDEIIMRIMDVLYGFPPVLMAILITSILGPGIRNSIIAIGIFNIPVFARLTRGSFLSIKERDFVQAARALGDRESVIIIKHIFPNIISPIIVQSATQFAVAILAEAALSYLG